MRKIINDFEWSYKLTGWRLMDLSTNYFIIMSILFGAFMGCWIIICLVYLMSFNAHYTPMIDPMACLRSKVSKLEFKTIAHYYCYKPHMLVHLLILSTISNHKWHILHLEQTTKKGKKKRKRKKKIYLFFLKSYYLSHLRLVSFVSTWHKLRSSGRREPQLRNLSLHQKVNKSVGHFPH